MTVTETPLPGVKVLHPVVHRDDRGFFLETYHQRRYVEAGVATTFVQDNHSRSGRGTLRGLHMQLTAQQAKLVRVITGEIFDVAVDVRVGSPTFGQWFGTRLSDVNFAQMFVPEGFAHGFAVVSDVAEVEYKCSAFYDGSDEIAIRFDDPAIGVQWPVTAPTLSRRDATAAPLADFLGRLPRFAAP
ncbi:MAG TPA: dTDP-4-dehydrorhamnose 3,5-epimerase [Vicinamibacterales bacterium]|nr:dTDP-4-dehydrorhamnose 3,5-epimerase [Vicinamibacterales bacterium]